MCLNHLQLHTLVRRIVNPSAASLDAKLYKETFPGLDESICLPDISLSVAGSNEPSIRRDLLTVNALYSTLYLRHTTRDRQKAQY